LDAEDAKEARARSSSEGPVPFPITSASRGDGAKSIKLIFVGN